MTNPSTYPFTATRGLAVVGLAGLALVGCGSTSATSATSGTSTTTAPRGTSPAVPGTTTAASGATGGSTAAGLAQAKWASGVTVSFSGDQFEFKSNGIPNHARQAQYALPNAGGRVPSAATAYAGDDPTTAQSYDYKITTNPTKAASTTKTSLGVIGVMISGATLFNPYEGDGSTVATASNFTVKDSAGNDVAFLDNCNGHPTPMGQYHYHALPACVTTTVDTGGGPSHLIGVAFDGFPIYGDRDLAGQPITVGQLDACGGITSATPEFPEGIYHYVLLDTADATSSIRCFSGTVDPSLTQMQGMPGGRG